MEIKTPNTRSSRFNATETILDKVSVDSLQLATDTPLNSLKTGSRQSERRFKGTHPMQNIVFGNNIMYMIG